MNGFTSLCPWCSSHWQINNVEYSYCIFDSLLNFQELFFKLFKLSLFPGARINYWSSSNDWFDYIPFNDCPIIIRLSTIALCGFWHERNKYTSIANYQSQSFDKLHVMIFKFGLQYIFTFVLGFHGYSAILWQNVIYPVKIHMHYSLSGAHLAHRVKLPLTMAYPQNHSCSPGKIFIDSSVVKDFLLDCEASCFQSKSLTEILREEQKNIWF